jgi:DNA-directed RNA polymerase subunit RPC12/RpoP
MAKCGVCNMEAKEQPKITSDGKCSLCGKKLMMEGQTKEQKK